MAKPNWDAINAANKKAVLGQMQGPDPTGAPAPPPPQQTEYAQPPLNTTMPAAPPQQMPAAPAGNVKDDFWGAVTQQGRTSLSPTDLDALLKDPRFAGIQRISPDVVGINGEQIDVIGDVGGANSVAWIDNANRARMAAGGGAGSGGGGGAIGAATGIGGASNDFQNQIRALLLKQMEGLSRPVDENDPAIRGELSSQDNAAERARRDRRAAAAERAAFQGLLNGGASSGAFDAEVASGFEDKATRMSDVRSQLFGRELSARRTQLAGMLQMAMQSGDAESARAIQMQIAQMDAELKRMGLSQQQSQFNDQFGLQGAQFQYLKDRDLAGFGAGG